jgi:hypothetical protein
VGGGVECVVVGGGVECVVVGGGVECVVVCLVVGVELCVVVCVLVVVWCVVEDLCVEACLALAFAFVAAFLVDVVLGWAVVAGAVLAAGVEVVLVEDPHAASTRTSPRAATEEFLSPLIDICSLP